MLYALAFAALTASPAQGGGVKLTNVRLTVGELGGARASAKFLPGDILFVAYEIAGLPTGEDGIVRYKMEMKVLDSTGKAIFKQDPRELMDFVPLRGNSIPARAFIVIGLDHDPGNYTCEISVEDPKSKTKDTLSLKFEVSKPEFGIVAVSTSFDPAGAISAPTTCVVGQIMMINFSVATFKRDPKTKQPNVELEYQFYDDKGAAILGQPGKDVVDGGVADTEGLFRKQFPLFLSRPGKFTVKITANDKIGGKKSTYELPVTVLASN
jgi:hypothetical protein